MNKNVVYILFIFFSDTYCSLPKLATLCVKALKDDISIDDLNSLPDTFNALIVFENVIKTNPENTTKHKKIHETLLFSKKFNDTTSQNMLDKLAPYLGIDYPKLLASVASDMNLSDTDKKNKIQILLNKKVDPSKALSAIIYRHDPSITNNMEILQLILKQGPNTAIDDNAIHSCLNNSEILTLVVEKSTRIKEDIRNYISNNILKIGCVNPDKYETLKQLDLFVLPPLKKILEKNNDFGPRYEVFKEYQKQYDRLSITDKAVLKKIIIEHACNTISTYQYNDDLKKMVDSDATFANELNTALREELLKRATNQDPFFIPIFKRIYQAQTLEEKKTHELYTALLSKFNQSIAYNHREKKIRYNSNISFSEPLGFSNILELIEVSKIPLTQDHQTAMANKITRIYTYAANKLFIRRNLFDRSLAIYKDILSLQQTLLTDNPENRPIDLTPLEKKIFTEHCLFASLFPSRKVSIADEHGKQTTYRTHMLNSASHVKKMCSLIKEMNPMFVDRLSEEGGKPYECTEQGNKNFSGRFSWLIDFAGEAHSRRCFPDQIATDLRPLEDTLLNRWWVYGIPRTPNLSLLFTTVIPGLSILSGSVDIAAFGIMLYVACLQGRSR